MQSAQLNGHTIDYDITEPDGGAPAGAATLLLVSGWCQDHRLFDPVLPLLAARHRVVRADWRGHGTERAVAGDFGVAEMADDTVALLDALEIERVVPVSTSHGGWANLEVTDRLGAARVPRTMVVDWLMPRAEPGFVASLRRSQDPDTWREGRQELFDIWLAMADSPAVARHLDREMASFGFEMWARSCRVIENAYATWGSPLERMAALKEPRPVAHLFSQPAEESYHQAQRAFAAEHPWFEPHRIAGETHFPTLENPGTVAECVLTFAAAETR
ncbi:alpha/beta fold hydrolase [Streptomyces iconiensis]|uniref:Alpha/beta hydrolase n=1 Tax=Streptomyces iconiensis TaxID=1384038 RepID=A0ABT6ZW62_9ACTN|nr:alpha/beta hydrolase [Streptomyces iconiensis]MDJ1133300.1 alpha/beta hydrolase [Streptomyces iconiensis]